MPIDNRAASAAVPVPVPAPVPIVRKCATADEIQAELGLRIAGLIERDARFGGCQAPRPRPSRVRQDGDPNWAVDGLPGLAPGCFGAIVRIVDQARLEYELVS